MKTLNVYYSMTFYKYSGKYYCNGAFGRYLDAMATKYDRITVCVPVSVANDSNQLDYEIKSNKIEFQAMPDYKNVIGAVKYFFPAVLKLVEYSKTWEKVYIRWPSPYSYFVYLLAKLKKIPVILHLVGDTRSVISSGSKYTGVKKYLALGMALVQEWCLKRMLRSANALVNGNGLRRLYQHRQYTIKEIRTSTFSKNEIYVRYDACQQEKVNLIYVGYLRHEKGLTFLIEAIDQLVKKGINNISLTIVGDGDEKADLMNMVEGFGLGNIINFKGYIPLGPELFALYRVSDLFVLPSLSEGTPRVLLEAMANGLPVIATNAGGIPFTVNEEHKNGILINPGKSDEIVAAIEKIISDATFRHALIENGYKFVNKNTLESHVDEVYGFIENSPHV